MQSDILLNKRLFSLTMREKMQLTTVRRKRVQKNFLRISFRNIIKEEEIKISEEIRLLPVFSREKLQYLFSLVTNRVHWQIFRYFPSHENTERNGKRNHLISRGTTHTFQFCMFDISNLFIGTVIQKYKFKGKNRYFHARILKGVPYLILFDY